jgi:hypothetical protein
MVLQDLHSSANIIKVIKSMKMKWAGHEVRSGENTRAHIVPNCL